MDDPVARTSVPPGESERPSSAGDPRAATRSDRLHALLLEAIARGEFLPDSRLPSEADLARRFGVSRPIVRETLARLRDRGLVRSRQGAGSFVTERPPQRGASVSPLTSVADIRRCLELRTVLEGQAAWLAAERHGPNQWLAIESALARLQAAAEADEPDAAADFEFHLAVARATGNPYFVDVLRLLHEHISFGIDLTRALSPRPAIGRWQRVAMEHHRIAAAICARDPVAAKEAMVVHLDNAWRRMYEGDPANEE